jgi:plasmid replication initiation protein
VNVAISNTSLQTRYTLGTPYRHRHTVSPCAYDAPGRGAPQKFIVHIQIDCFASYIESGKATLFQKFKGDLDRGFDKIVFCEINEKKFDAIETKKIFGWRVYECKEHYEYQRYFELLKQGDRELKKRLR